MTRLAVVCALMVCWSASVPAQVSWTPGWRPGFAQCVTSANPDLPNYYSEAADCPIAGSHQWLVGVQAEREFATSCNGGPNGQSLPLNSEEGPVFLRNINGEIQMTVDLYNYRHPCPQGGQFTWLSFMDNVGSYGGPLPAADVLKVYYRGIFYETIGDQQGMSRMGLTWLGRWAGKVLYVEVNLYIHPSWGDGDPAPDIVVNHTSGDQIYIQMRGDRMTPAYAIAGSVEQSVTVDFAAVVRDLIARGYLPAPPLGVMPTVVVGLHLETFTWNRNRHAVASQIRARELRAFQ